MLSAARLLVVRRGVRQFSIQRIVRSEHIAPSLFGPGAKAGEMPTDEQQATGLERFQLLAEQQGVDAFDKSPLDSSRIGTLEDPIKVFCLVRVREAVVLPHRIPCSF